MTGNPLFGPMRKEHRLRRRKIYLPKGVPLADDGGGLQLDFFMNKKAYITPEMEVMNVETVEMIAASVLSINEEGGEEQSLGTGRRGSWGNLWN